jgi:hypothetical protein
VAPGSGEIRSVPAAPADADRFVRTMPPPRAVQDSQTYEKLVLSLDPTVYYRMERPKKEKDRLIVNDCTGRGRHGVLHFSADYRGRPYLSGRFGEALNFRGPMVGDYAIVPDYPKAAADQLTVSVWVLAIGRPRRAMIAANWGHPPPGSGITGQFHIGLYFDGDLSACVTQRDGQRVEVREGASYLFPLNTWQHVALVADGTVLRLYRNGMEVDSVPCAGVLHRPLVASLGIGCKTDSSGAAPPSPAAGNFYSVREFFWLGQIDELAVFNRALTAEQVAQLYRGKSSPSGTGKTPAAPGGRTPAPPRRSEMPIPFDNKPMEDRPMEQ